MKHNIEQNSVNKFVNCKQTLLQFLKKNEIYFVIAMHFFNYLIIVTFFAVLFVTRKPVEMFNLTRKSPIQWTLF